MNAANAAFVAANMAKKVKNYGQEKNSFEERMLSVVGEVQFTIKLL